MESVQVPPPPHDYAGLGIQAPGAGLDQDGYLVVVGDPECGGQPQACIRKCINCVAWLVDFNDLKPF